MKRDWDYVAMSDYRADMAENTARAAAIVSDMKKRKSDVEQFLIAAVLAAGGKITIHHRDRHDALRAILTIERNEADDTTIVTARR